MEADRKLLQQQQEVMCDAPSWCFRPLAGRVVSLSWHPAGSLIAAGMVDMIRIFDANTGEDGSGGASMFANRL